MYWMPTASPYRAKAGRLSMPTVKRHGNRTADKIFDLQESTFWQTVDNTAFPHQVVIDLGKEYNVSGFRMLPRAEKGAPGLIKDYAIYVKTNDFKY